MSARPPAILVVIEAYLPDLTGAATQTGELVERLRRRGHRITVLCRRNQPGAPRREVRDGVTILRLRPTAFRRFGKYLMLPGLWWAARRAARQHDLILVCSFKITGWPLVAIGRRQGRPVALRADLMHELDGGFVLNRLGWGKGLAGTLAARLVARRNRTLLRANAWIGISQVILDEYARCGVPPDRVHRITCGVDTERFRPVDEEARAKLRQQLGLPRDAIILAYAGRLSRGKGLEDLMTAFAELAPGNQQLHLLLIGSGSGWSISIEEPLRARVAAAGLASRVTFAGHRHDVERWLQASDLFVFLSEEESLGIAPAEAQACGLPVVASRVGGLPEVVRDGETGLLVPPRDPQQAAAAVARLLSDSGKRRAMAEAGRQHVLRHFNLDHIADQHQELFARLAGEWRQSSPRADSWG